VSSKELFQKLEAYRADISAKISADLVHNFAKTVDDIGYVSSLELEREKIDFKRLVRQVYRYYRKLLKQNPDDAVAINNIGVFISNNGDPRRARPYFAKAVRLLPTDKNIHENLRVADILMRKSKKHWHDYQDGLQPGEYTLAAYFDPHGM